MGTYRDPVAPAATCARCRVPIEVSRSVFARDGTLVCARCHAVEEVADAQRIIDDPRNEVASPRGAVGPRLSPVPGWLTIGAGAAVVVAGLASNHLEGFFGLVFIVIGVIRVRRARLGVDKPDGSLDSD